MFASLAKRWSFFAIVGGLLCLALPAQAGAAPACPSVLKDNLEIDFPSRVAADRKVYGTITVSTDSSAYQWSTPSQIDVSLAREGAEPFWTGTWDILYSTTFWLTLGDRRNYEFSATATFRNGSQTCDVTAVREISGFRGQGIQLKIRPRLSYFNNGTEFEWRCPNAEAYETDPQPLTFWIEDFYNFKEIKVREDCENRARVSPSRVKAENWTAGRWLSDSLDLTFKRNRSPFRVTVTAFQGSRKLAKLTFKVRWVRRPARQIWIGSDAFINYCINELRPIKSEGGRLYCRTKNKSFNKVKVIRRR